MPSSVIRDFLVEDVGSNYALLKWSIRPIPDPYRFTILYSEVAKADGQILSLPPNRTAVILRYFLVTKIN